MQLLGLGIVGVEREGGLDLAGGAGDVAAAEQGDGEVVVVVGVVGVGGRRRGWKSGTASLPWRLAATASSLTTSGRGRRLATKAKAVWASAYLAMLKRARPR